MNRFACYGVRKVEEIDDFSLFSGNRRLSCFFPAHVIEVSFNSMQSIWKAQRQQQSFISIALGRSVSSSLFYYPTCSTPEQLNLLLFIPSYFSTSIEEFTRCSAPLLATALSYIGIVSWVEQSANKKEYTIKISNFIDLEIVSFLPQRVALFKPFWTLSKVREASKSLRNQKQKQNKGIN